MKISNNQSKTRFINLAGTDNGPFRKSILVAANVSKSGKILEVLIQLSDMDFSKERMNFLSSQTIDIPLYKTFLGGDRLRAKLTGEGIILKCSQTGRLGGRLSSD